MKRGKFLSSTRQRASVIATLGVAALLAGCSTGGATGSDKEPTELVFAGAGGNYQTAYTQVFDAFEAKTGIRVRYITGTLETAFAQVRKEAPQSVDLILTNSVTQITGQSQGLFEQLDPKLIPNLADVHAASDLPDGVKFGVPIHFSGLGIVYNADKFAAAGIPAPKSWLDLWDPRLAGKVAVTDASLSYTWDFISVISQLEGGSTTDFEPGLKKIAELRDMGVLAQCPTTLPQLATLFQQDAVWAAVDTRTRMADLTGLPVKFVSPEPTGATLFENYLAVPIGASASKEAQELINFMLTPASQKILSDQLAQAPVMDGVDTANTDLPASDDLLVIDRSAQVPLIDKYIAGWRADVGEC